MTLAETLQYNTSLTSLECVPGCHRNGVTWVALPGRGATDAKRRLHFAAWAASALGTTRETGSRNASLDGCRCCPHRSYPRRVVSASKPIG